MTKAELYQWIADPSLLSKSSLQELRQMVDDFPYFHAVRMLYLKNLEVLDDIRLEKELKKMSVHVPDRRQLFMLINDRRFNNKPEEQKTSSGSENKTERALQVIEKNLPPETPDEDDFVSKIISKPVSPAIATSDYVNWLEENAEDLPEASEAENRLRHQDLIDSFMEKDGSQFSQRLGIGVTNKAAEADKDIETAVPEALGKNALDDSYFTETLARVYINQKRYDKALEIIRVLSLKYPEKNVYFADQIRYLEKIINIKK